MRIDLEAPVIETVSVKEGTADSVQVVWKVTDNVDIVRVDLYRDDTPVVSTLENANVVSFDFYPDNRSCYRLVFWDSALNARERTFYPVSKEQK